MYSFNFKIKSIYQANMITKIFSYDHYFPLLCFLLNWFLETIWYLEFITLMEICRDYCDGQSGQARAVTGGLKYLI